MAPPSSMVAAAAAAAAHFHQQPPRSLHYPSFFGKSGVLPPSLLPDYPAVPASLAAAAVAAAAVASGAGPQTAPTTPTSAIPLTQVTPSAGGVETRPVSAAMPGSYGSPPPITSSDPTANECQLVDYRGHKVAAFIINGEPMLCLPQAFELFLKHLVGGLHTVYTKLKRLDIVPLVCNVEQVRILRGLGSIQPGVNRCKLLSVKEFDILYRDCTTARPGRPPKRAPGFTMNSSPDTLLKLKHSRMDSADMFENNAHIRDSLMEKSPLLSNGFNHSSHLNPLHYMALSHPAAAAQAAQAAALFGPAAAAGLPSLPSGATLPRSEPPQTQALIKPPHSVQHELMNRNAVWENCRAAYEDVVKQLESRLKNRQGEPERYNGGIFDLRPHDLSVNCGSPNGASPVLNLSKSGEGSNSEGHISNREEDEMDEDEEEKYSDTNEVDTSDAHQYNGNELVSAIPLTVDTDSDTGSKQLPHSSPVAAISCWTGQLPQAAANVMQQASAAIATGADGAGGDPLGSTEHLLRNIQGLLKVATDSARQKERQVNYEKAELKMGLLREKEVRQSLERKLVDEQKLRLVYQRRLKKERRFRRRLQERMGGPQRPQKGLSPSARQQIADSVHTTASTGQYMPVISEKGGEAAVMRSLAAKMEPAVSSPLALEARNVFYGAAPMFSPAT